MNCSDPDDNVGKATIHFNFDSTDPVIAVKSLKGSKATPGSFVLSGTSSDATSGIKEVLVKFDSAPYQGANGTSASWSFAVSGLLPGDHTLAVKATDVAGNSKQLGGKFTLPEGGLGETTDTSIDTEAVKDVENEDDRFLDSISSVTLDGVTYSATSSSQFNQLTTLEIIDGISVKATFDNPGLVELTLPKSMIEDITAVKVKGQNLDFDVIAVTDTYTAISFGVPNGGVTGNTVEISGARVVPEFPMHMIGMLAMIIAGVAIVSRISLFKRAP